MLRRLDGFTILVMGGFVRAPFFCSLSLSFGCAMVDYTFRLSNNINQVNVEQNVRTIRRNQVLREYDIKETPGGRQNTFSVKFIKKNGELVFIPLGVASGLPFHVAHNRMRGVRPVDKDLNPVGHIHAVDIDALVEWNGFKVVL